MKGKSGQVTIFIIIAIIIVALVALIFILRKDIEIPGITGGEIQPRSFLQTCLEDKIQEGTKLISEQGGSINPIFYKEFKFENEESYTNISYLCYAQDYYSPCVNQQPMLISHIEDEIKTYISSDVRSCFIELVESLEGQSYEVSDRYNGFDVELGERKIMININAELTLRKQEESSRQEDFEIGFPSRLYDLVIVTQRIINKEVLNCDFDVVEHSQLYPEYEIEKSSASEFSKMYTIRYKNSPEFIRFA